MKIKKLLLGVMGMSLMMTSCNLDNNEEENYMTWTFPCCNLVVPTTGNPSASSTTYGLLYYYTNNTLVASTSDLSLGYGTYNFKTNAMTAKTDYYSFGNVTSFQGGSSASGNVTVQQLKGYMSTLFNAVASNETETFGSGYTFTPVSPLVMQYTVDNDYTVKTFMPDAIYTGNTTVSAADGSVEPFTNEGIKYRVVFHKELNKADVLFYNAKFTPVAAAPTIHFALLDLDVEYLKNGYKISGNSIVPQQYVKTDEGAKWVPYESYPLESFQLLNTSEDLTVAQATYVVLARGARYICTFSGAYVYDSVESES